MHTDKSVTHPETDSGLTNHLPMALSALVELGSSEAQRQRYTDRASTRLRWAEPSNLSIANDAELFAWLGQRQQYSALHRYLSQQLAQLGIAATLNRYLPALVDGLSTAAFHALIRLGHAVHDKDSEEVAAALAYWVWAHNALRFPAGDQPQRAEPLAIVAGLLEGVDWPTERFGDRLISNEFLAVMAHPSYPLLRFQLTPDSLSFSALRSLAIRAYWMHEDFTLLHGVTGVLAAERVSQWLDEPDQLLEPLWRGLVVAWLSKGLRWQPTAEPPGEPAFSIDELRHWAAQANNDHTIKLVAACISHYHSSQDALFLHAAQRCLEHDRQLSQAIAEGR